MDAKVVTAPTEGDWRIYKGWIHPSFDGPSPQTTNADVAICEPLGPDAAINARLIVAACNSYQRHCPDPVSAAEGDLLGRALEALRMAAPLLAEAREALCGRDDVCTTSDGDDALLPLRDAINFILSQAREVK